LYKYPPGTTRHSWTKLKTCSLLNMYKELPMK
jgi:hypothetical protein